jgi:hypothetical protein
MRRWVQLIEKLIDFDDKLSFENKDRCMYIEILKDKAL